MTRSRVSIMESVPAVRIGMEMDTTQAGLQLAWEDKPRIATTITCMCIQVPWKNAMAWMTTATERWTTETRAVDLHVRRRSQVSVTQARSTASKEVYSASAT